MAYSKEIIEYARELYLTVDERGRRAWSITQITEKIQERFKKKVAYDTIGRWANKYGWKKLLETSAKAAAIQAVQPKIASALDATKEEQLFDSITAAKQHLLAELYQDIELINELLERKKGNPRAVRESFSRLLEVKGRHVKTILESLEGGGGHTEERIIIVASAAAVGVQSVSADDSKD